MFIVKSIKTGACLACEKETECYEVESEGHAFAGLLCPQDFRKQVKIASARPHQPVDKTNLPPLMENRIEN